LRRLLTESPGVKLEADSFAALATLFGTVLGRYPAVAAHGIMPPPPGAGGDFDKAAADVSRLTLDTAFTADALPPLPLALQLLLLPTSVAACDPEHLEIEEADDDDEETVIAAPAAVVVASNADESASTSVWMSMTDPSGGNPFIAAAAAASVAKPAVSLSNPFAPSASNPFGAVKAVAATVEEDPASAAGVDGARVQPKAPARPVAPGSRQAATATSRKPLPSHQVFATVRSAAHAAALRGVLIGTSQSSPTSSQGNADLAPGNSASAGVRRGGTSSSLLGVALDIVAQVSGPLLTHQRV
jgi:hypothetical protein